MPYIIEHNKVTYRNNGNGWFVNNTGELVPKILGAELDGIIAEKLRAKEEKITDPKELLQLAAKYSSQGMLERALAICSKIIAISPDNELVASTVISSILRKKGEPEKALAITDKFQTTNNPAMLTTRAATLCDLENWELAKKTISRALAILKGASNKGEAFGVVGRIKAARPDLYNR